MSQSHFLRSHSADCRNENGENSSNDIYPDNPRYVHWPQRKKENGKQPAGNRNHAKKDDQTGDIHTVPPPYRDPDAAGMRRIVLNDAAPAFAKDLGETEPPSITEKNVLLKMMVSRSNSRQARSLSDSIRRGMGYRAYPFDFVTIVKIKRLWIGGFLRYTRQPRFFGRACLVN